MVTSTIMIGGDGIRSRQSQMIVQTANKYKSKIMIRHKGRFINAKSMMGIFALGVAVGENVELSADGEDEREAMADMQQVIGGFAGA